MSKQVAVMPSLEVIVERLPKAVIDAVIGSVEVSVSSIMESIQRPVTLKSSVKTDALLRNVAMKSMPSLRVTLERLPKDVMIDLLARKKIFCMTLEKRKISKPRKIRSSLYKYDNV